jgi:endogenous inhibitor of DNA gyrase (YacG/DUF329 family)
MFTLHTKVDVPFVKHEWSKCPTAFPCNVNTTNTQQRATPFCSVRNENIVMRNRRWKMARHLLSKLDSYSADKEIYHLFFF